MIEAPVAPARPIETITPIKPSEAIRLGSLTTRQAFGSTVADVNTPMMATCAIGAMYVGLGWVPGSRISPSPTVDVVNPLLSKAFDEGSCPADTSCHILQRVKREAMGNLTLHRVVVHLNDQHSWRREDIADWLEGQGL